MSVSARGIGLGVLAAAPVAAASLLGGLATYSEIPVWYAGLAKPSFNPPNWIFGPVWTTLYVLMGYSFWRILRLPQATAGRSGAIAVFVVQIVLNAAWSWAFFWGHSPPAGMAVIMLLWVAIALTIVKFARLDRVAAWLFAPYLAWVSFAALLNMAIWRLNG